VILRWLNSRTVDLDRRPRGPAEGERRRFTLVEQALLGGKALCLFFPAMRRVYFEDPSAAVPGWQDMHLYLTYGPGMMKSLGLGEAGRMFFISKCIEKGMDQQAESELRIMLELHPDDPNLIGMLGDIARRQGDAETLRAAAEKLERLAAKEDPAGAAHEALNNLRRPREGPLH
jgi:hypothetical protein